MYLNDEKHPILYYRRFYTIADFILSPCYLPINLHPMFTLRYRKSRDNLSSSDVKFSSRIHYDTVGTWPKCGLKESARACDETGWELGVLSS